MSSESVMKECVDCNAEFELTASEQDYFDQKNLSHPKRCKNCRKLKRERNAQREREEKLY